MKKTSIFGGIATLFFLFVFNAASAQSNTSSTQDQVQPTQTEETETTEAEEVSESPEKVTIAEDQASQIRTSSNDSNTGRNESSTKVYIYSGKHDGNNVINPDPKNRY